MSQIVEELEIPRFKPPFDLGLREDEDEDDECDPLPQFPFRLRTIPGINSVSLIAKAARSVFPSEITTKLVKSVKSVSCYISGIRIR